MIRVLLAFSIAFLLGVVCGARAQPVTVIGPVTVGDIPQFNSPTVIKDSGIAASSIPTCTGPSAGAFPVYTGTAWICSTAINSLTLNGAIATNANSAGVTSFTAISNLGSGTIGDFGVRNSARVAYGTLVATDGYAYSNNNLTLMADNATGIIKFAAGGNALVAKIGAGTTPTLTLSPAALSTTQGLAITQSGPASGTTVGPLIYNPVNITHSSTVSLNGTDPFRTDVAQGLQFIMTTGGANVGGYVEGASFRLNHTTAGTTASANDMIALWSGVYNTVSKATGGIYGHNTVIWVANNSSVVHAVGSEMDHLSDAGTSITNRVGYRSVSFGPVQGSTADAAFSIANGTTTGWKTGLLVGETNGFGAVPISTTGDIFASGQAFTVANIFNMANVTVTGSIFNFANFTMSGAGAGVAAVSFRSPLFIGGTGTTGTQATFQTTTGNGTTDQFAWKLGNNGATTVALMNSLGLAITTSGAAATVPAQGGLEIYLNSITINGTHLQNANSGGVTAWSVFNDNGVLAEYGMRGSARASYGTLVANDAYLYTNSSTGLTFMADNATGIIKFATGGNTLRWSIDATGALVSGTAAKTVVLKQGANGTVGTFICTAAGTITITNSNVAITDAIIISLNLVGGTPLTPTMKTIVAATNFSVLCGGADTSTYNYAIIKNAA